MITCSAAAGNPWGNAAEDRENWAEGLAVPTIREAHGAWTAGPDAGDDRAEVAGDLLPHLLGEGVADPLVATLLDGVEDVPRRFGGLRGIGPEDLQRHGAARGVEPLAAAVGVPPALEMDALGVVAQEEIGLERLVDLAQEIFIGKVL